MRDPIILLVHLIATLARLMGPVGTDSAACTTSLDRTISPTSLDIGFSPKSVSKKTGGALGGRRRLC